MSGPNPTPQKTATELSEEQQHKLDPNIIQKYLFVNSDKIYKKINNPANDDNAGARALFATPNSDVKILGKSILNKTFSRQEAATFISRQHELMSLNMVPSFESAKELFIDPKDQNWFINNAYTISHNIIFSKNSSKYIFNIDELNQIANTEKDAYGGIGAKFLIHKISIVNQSKDTFTARSNFKVSLHIVFNYFEDLKEEIIRAKNLYNPSAPIEKFSLLSLLYPFYSKNSPIKMSNKDKETKKSDGLILNQILNLADPENKYFKQTKQDLEGIKEIHKNYHLTFHKHLINIFKSNDPFLKGYDSELIIDYVSYEADETTSLLKDKNTPTAQDNVYSLLFNNRADQAVGQLFRADSKGNENIYKAFTDILESYSKEVNNLEVAISCANKGLKTKEDVGLAVDPANKKEFVEAAGVKIRQVQEKMNSLRQELNTNLFKYIVSNLDVYTVNIKRSALVAYQQADYFSETTKIFSGYAGLSAGLGAGAASIALTTGLIVATGGTALVAGAAIGALIGLGGSAIASRFSAQGDVFSKSIFLLRENFDDSSISRYGKGNYFNEFIKGQLEDTAKKQYDENTDGDGIPVLIQQLQGRLNSENNEQEKQNLQNQINELNKKLDKKALKADAAKSINDKTIKESSKLLHEGEEEVKDIDGEIRTGFILFGQIIDLLPRQDSYIIFGGKTIAIDGNFNSIYLNYYYTPIHITKFLDFLNDKIMKRTDQTYSSEVFLRDIVDNLLKDCVKDSSGSSALLKEFVPTHINMNVALTDDSDSKTTQFTTAIEKNILDNNVFADIKKYFIKAKNLRPQSKAAKKLKKIYTITAEEEIKYFNFYGAYKDWRFLKKPPNTPKSSEIFQEFILENYAMPCIRTKANDKHGSILSTKNLTFTRKDNPNLVTGQTLDNSSLLRLPYSVTGQFKPYIFFFIDVASFMFIAPPEKRDGSMDTEDTFGYGGLYLVKGSNFEYNFQVLGPDGAPTFPNEKSKCEYTCQMISYGDGLIPGVKEGDSPVAEADKVKPCSDPVPVSQQPTNLPN